MQTEEQYEIIEAYLAGTLSEEERIRFEKTMDTDPALASDVQLHRELANTFSDPAYISMRKVLDDVAEEFRSDKTEPTPKGFSGGKWLLLLTGLGVILILGMWFWPLPSHKEQNVALPQMPPLSAPSDSKPDNLSPEESRPSSQLENPEGSSKPEDPFKTNPSLERAMTLPGNTYYVIKEGRVESERLNRDNSYEIRFQALLTTALEPPSMYLEFLNNRLPDGTVLHQLPVEVTPVKDSENIRAFGGKKTWQLTAKLNINVAPGLYYQRLVIASDQQVLWWSKSEIK